MNPRLATRKGVTAEEVLYILNGQQTVPLDRISFLVVTGTYIPHRLEPAWPFTPGEIIPVLHDRDGSREFLGQRRDPDTDWEDSGWCTHQCDSLDEALELAALVTSDRPRGYYEWTDDGLSYMSDQDAAHWQWAGAADWYVRVADHAGRGHWAEQREQAGS
ncbi:hypothetical protein PYK79_11030 [Streptomyces sp. ID05-04B]|uniref:hypothetical protein n=1 Tax=Streptomyces sp. ID05-04B TaxID=3028661 RepID=UPI0029C34589|nr:hypothetical protein [Streptomyces sp. ID05-04B]MDX5563787.1 hypothetical protein [Streptomyces sp. ID05-04B]